MKQLTEQAIDLIRSSGSLYGSVAECVGVRPESLRRILDENKDPRLADPSVVALIEDYRKIKVSELQDMAILSELQAA